MSSEIMNLPSQSRQDMDDFVASVGTSAEGGEDLVGTQNASLVTNETLLDAWSNLESGGET